MLKKALVIPTYLPTISTMAVLVQATEPVLEIRDNYQKQSYRNRTYINTANGRLALTIPVRHTHNGKHKKTADALIENNFLWQRQHWRSIQIAYRSSPFFEFYEDDMANIYNRKYDRLQEFNLKGIHLILEMLGTTKDFKMTESYENNPELLDLRMLANAKNKKSAVSIPVYDQVFADTNDFNAQVSIIDLIFNEGPNALNYLTQLSLENIS